MNLGQYNTRHVIKHVTLKHKYKVIKFLEREREYLQGTKIQTTSARADV